MPPAPPFARWLSDTNEVTRIFLAAGGVPDLVNMAGGLPDPVTWPVEDLAEMAARLVRDHPVQALGYAPIEGLPGLRDVLAARFSTPALRLTRDNVLVTSGGMQALDLIGKALLDEGGLIAAQSPTYLGALDAWRPRGPRYRPMRIGAEGFDPRAALAGARFAYAVPNFSNPTGRLVTLAEREALVAAARDTGTWLVEDDPYGTLHYDGAPLPRILSLAGEAGDPGPVVYLGTLSKELAPGLRVGWAVARPEMIAALTAAKQGSDMSSGGLNQLIALHALESGLAERARPAALALYRARRDALCAAMDRHLSADFDWQVPLGGMFVWAVARDPGLDTDRLLPAALAEGVCIAPGSVFDPEGRDRRAIRLNFTLNPPDRLEEGVRRLAAALRALRRAA